MTLRRAIFWLHLCAGLLVGLVIAFLAMTGCILAFQPQIVGWAERGARIASPATAECVAPSVLLQSAANYAHGTPTTLTLYSDNHRPAEIAFGADSVVLAESCDGHVIGNGAGKLRGFFQAVRDLHRWVALNGVRHETLRQIKNICVVAFVFLIVSGTVLWFPRKFAWQHVRPTLFFRAKLRGRARDWNWHMVCGFWMSVPLLVIALSGIVMAYGWANALLFRAAGSPPPPERAEAELRRPKPLPAAKLPLLDISIQRALAQDTAWKSIQMRLPAEKDQNIAFTLDDGDGGQPQYRAQLVVARKDGRVVRWEPFSANSRGRQWRLYARFLHTGEVFGIAGRSVAAAAMLSTLVLVWTGFALAWRRLISWKKHNEVRAKLVRELEQSAMAAPKTARS